MSSCPCDSKTNSSPDEHEQALLRAAREWRATFDAISDCVSVHDLDHRIVRCNAAFASWFGDTPKNLIGRKCYELIHGSDAPVDECPHTEALEKGCPITKDVGAEPESGVILQVTCSPYCDQDGNVVGTAHIARNVTQLRRSEEEKGLLLAELQEAMANIRLLTGLLPICSYCKNIRDDEGYWQQIESYIGSHSNAQFSHSVCPDCIRKNYPDMADALLGKE
jgi:PAS domain S-box-containing protein